jgi:hypothetical protein
MNFKKILLLGLGISLINLESWAKDDLNDVWVLSKLATVPKSLRNSTYVKNSKPYKNNSGVTCVDFTQTVNLPSAGIFDTSQSLEETITACQFGKRWKILEN